jgi:hypothetical protein
MKDIDTFTAYLKHLVHMHGFYNRMDGMCRIERVINVGSDGPKSADEIKWQGDVEQSEVTINREILELMARVLRNPKWAAELLEAERSKEEVSHE